MSIDIKGTVVHIGETQTIGAKGFQKRILVVKTDEKYPQEIPIEATREHIAELDSLTVGGVVSVSVNIRGRAWQDKWFVSLEAWKIQASAGAQPSAAPSSPAGEQDSIPF
jgi:hypothetical protein